MTIAKRASLAIRLAAVTLGCLFVMSFVLHTDWARVTVALVVILVYFVLRYRS